MNFQKITPCLWLDGQAEEAARFYTLIFKNSRMGSLSRYGEEGQEIHGQSEGAAMVVEFEMIFPTASYGVSTGLLRPESRKRFTQQAAGNVAGKRFNVSTVWLRRVCRGASRLMRPWRFSGKGNRSFVGWHFAAALLALVTLAVQAASVAADVTPQRVQAALGELDQLAEQTLKRTGVPGMALAVVYKDKVVHLKGFGVREVGKEDRVDADTVFQLASVSKPIASTVLAALVGKGVIGWDDQVIEHDPNFRLYDPWVTHAVTFRDLLCHRSGLPEHAGDLLEDVGYGRAEVLRRLRFVKPASSFRSQYAYTNFGYTEAAVAGAQAAGVAWEDLAANMLFRPLGMKSSSFRFADYMAAANRARLHVRVNGKWVAKYIREPDAQSPAGGASSTARDLAQWLRLHLGGGKLGGEQVIAAEALAETHRPQIISHVPEDPATDRAGFYGLGWNVNYDGEGRVRLGHSGAFGLGAATAVALLPDESLGIVVLTNATPMGVPEALSASFFDLVLKGKIEKDWLDEFQPAFAAMLQPAYGKAAGYYAKPPAEKSPPLPFKTYLGTYRNDLFGDIEVVERDGALVLRLGPKLRPFALRHWDRDVFIYQPQGENAGGLSGVTFWVGPDRKASRVVVEDLDIQGQGTFTRPATKK
jgi:CubicO group peptidase (beta-lactamase class C family)